MYGIEACPTHSSDIKTLDHPITATFMKVFNTKSTDVIPDCQMAFRFCSLHEQILTRKINFLNKFISCSNSICSVTLANCAKNAHSAEPIRQLQVNKYCKRYMLTYKVTGLRHCVIFLLQNCQLFFFFLLLLSIVV